VESKFVANGCLLLFTGMSSFPNEYGFLCAVCMECFVGIRIDMSQATLYDKELLFEQTTFWVGFIENPVTV
jgi:hypothetical protein